MTTISLEDDIRFIIPSVIANELDKRYSGNHGYYPVNGDGTESQWVKLAPISGDVKIEVVTKTTEKGPHAFRFGASMPMPDINLDAERFSDQVSLRVLNVSISTANSVQLLIEQNPTIKRFVVVIDVRVIQVPEEAPS